MTTKKKEKEENQEWRDLCDLISKEKDPQRLSQLVDNLIRAMDERKQRLKAEAKKDSGSNPSGN
jgi:hypothetical protein